MSSTGASIIDSPDWHSLTLYLQGRSISHSALALGGTHGDVLQSTSEKANTASLLYLGTSYRVLY